MATESDVSPTTRSVQTQDPELVKGLGLTSATTLVIGSMIGSGIFIVSADMARLLNSPALLMIAWAITGLITVIAALSYGELAAMMPRAGGQYIYLREAYSPLWGFLYGWTFFLIIQTGTVAAVAVAFGKFLGYFFPAIAATEWMVGPWRAGTTTIAGLQVGGWNIGLNTQNLIAILMVWVLTVINVFGVRTGAMVQNIFTFAKTAALLGLALLGVFIGRNAEAIAANFGNFWQNASLTAQHQVTMIDGTTVLVGTLTIIAIAQVGSLFSSDAWNYVTFTAGEVKNPARNLPLSLAIGTSTVIVLYLLANLAYLNVLPLWGDPQGTTFMERGIQYAPEDRVGTAAMAQMFGAAGAALMTVAILVSVFGCNNGLILAGARAHYAMAKDGLFFRQVAYVHPRYRTPVVSLMVQGVWTSLLCLSGTYGELLDYIMFATILFYILTMAGIFVLRWKRPDAERPYKAFGYPFLPALYIAIAIFIDAVLLIYKPQYTFPGLVIVLLGIPVYFLWRRRSAPV